MKYLVKLTLVISLLLVLAGCQEIADTSSEQRSTENEFELMANPAPFMFYSLDEFLGSYIAFSDGRVTDGEANQARVLGFSEITSIYIPYELPAGYELGYIMAGNYTMVAFMDDPNPLNDLDGFIVSSWRYIDDSERSDPFQSQIEQLNNLGIPYIIFDDKYLLVHGFTSSDISWVDESGSMILLNIPRAMHDAITELGGYQYALEAFPEWRYFTNLQRIDLTNREEVLSWIRADIREEDLVFSQVGEADIYHAE